MSARDDYPLPAGPLARSAQRRAMCDEIDRLRAQVERDRPLIDDLADVLARMVVGWEPIIGHDLAQHPDVVRVMARYGGWRTALDSEEQP